MGEIIQRQRRDFVKTETIHKFDNSNFVELSE